MIQGKIPRRRTQPMSEPMNNPSANPTTPPATHEAAINAALNAIHTGVLVSCSATEYHEVIRKTLQDAAARYIDQNDGVRAMIALREVSRLDGKFGMRGQTT
jgi:hypothetical protein